MLKLGPGEIYYLIAIKIVIIMFIFKKFEDFTDTHSEAIENSFLANSLIKSRNQNIF